MMLLRSNKFNASCNAEAERKTGASEPLTETSEQVSKKIVQLEKGVYLPKPTIGIAFMVMPNKDVTN